MKVDNNYENAKKKNNAFCMKIYQILINKLDPEIEKFAFSAHSAQLDPEIEKFAFSALSAQQMLSVLVMSARKDIKDQLLDEMDFLSPSDLHEADKKLNLYKKSDSQVKQELKAAFKVWLIAGANFFF